MKSGIGAEPQVSMLQAYYECDSLKLLLKLLLIVMFSVSLL